MIQVYIKEAFKPRATSIASALKALIHVYHTLFFIIPALQSEKVHLSDFFSKTSTRKKIYIFPLLQTSRAHCTSKNLGKSNIF
jgi:hypothetical protein